MPATASAESPIKELASAWRSAPMPGSWISITEARATLLIAAVSQIKSKAKSNIPYNPFHCPIFRWCSQWLDVAEKNRPGIDPEVEFLFHLTMDPAPFSKQFLAANDPFPTD